MPHLTAKRSDRPGRLAASTVLLLSWCIFLNADDRLFAQQQETMPLLEDTVRGVRITQRFEIYNPHSREQLQVIKAMGFTQVILDWPNLHEEATKLGLDVVLANWWTQETKAEEIELGLNWARQVERRRLSAISLMDEPERNSPDTPFSYYRDLYTNLRARLDRETPHVALEISHWGPLSSWTPEFYAAFAPLYQSADRIRLMPYPDLNEEPLSEVYYQMLRSRRLMKLTGRNLPQVVILQTWMLPENPKLPTMAELRVMAYLAILGGADTLSFFNYDPDLWSLTEGFTEDFAHLMAELTAFARRHPEAVVDSQLSPTGIFTATVTPASGAPTSVVINTNRRHVDDLAGLAVVIREPAPSPLVNRCIDGPGATRQRTARCGGLLRSLRCGKRLGAGL